MLFIEYPYWQAKGSINLFFLIYLFYCLIYINVLAELAIAALPLNQDTYTQTITQRPFPTALPSAVAETRTQKWYSD